MRWDILTSEIVYRCRIFALRRDHSRARTNGATFDFHVLEMSDFANIIPLTADGCVVMVRQFRHGIGDLTLEVPAGIVDSADADPAAAALRELREETGYTARRTIALGTVHPNPAIMNNRCHVFAAYDVALAGPAAPDATEELEGEVIPLERIPQLIRDGIITNALTVVSFQFFDWHRRHAAGDTHTGN